MSGLAPSMEAEFSIRLIINMVSMIVLLRFIYFRRSLNRDALFGFMAFGLGVFLVTGLLSKIEMSIGFAFGLFAVFSMLRYRTEAMSIRDMTYLFLVIVVSLVSSVAPIEVIELIVINSLVCLFAAVFEMPQFAPRIETKRVRYESLDYIKPEEHDLLAKEVVDRTGLDVLRVAVRDIDYLNDTVVLRVYYRADQSHSSHKTQEKT